VSDTEAQASGLTVSDWLVPLAVFVFCAVVIWLSLGLEAANPIIVGHAMQPRAYPILLAIIAALLGVILCRQILGQGHSIRKHIPYQTWLSMVITGIFYVIGSLFDFFLGLACAMFLMCLVWGERRLWVAATIAIAAPLITFFVFDLALGKRFPRGILTNLYYGA